MEQGQVARRIKRVLDSAIRHHESRYRWSVAAGAPSMAELGARDALQKVRSKLVGDTLRSFTRQEKLL